MLIVRTYVAASDVEGVGVFAAEPISAGAKIWVFDPAFDRVVTRDWVETQGPMMQEFLTRYAYPYREDPKQLIIEIDNGRFMNHSETPNTDFTSKSEGFARMDINPGDELTCDYHEFDPTFALLPSLAATFLKAGRSNAKAH